MSEETTVQTITVDGVEQDLSTFSVEVQRLVSIHQKWEQQLAEARLEVARGEAAIRELKRELISKIQAEQAPVDETMVVEGEVVA